MSSVASNVRRMLCWRISLLVLYFQPQGLEIHPLFWTSSEFFLRKSLDSILRQTPPVLSKVNCFNEKSLDFGFLHYIMNPSLFLLIKCLAWFVPDNVESHTNGAYYHDQDTFHNELLQWVGRHHVLSDPKCCWFANERVPWRFTQPYRTVSEHFSILYV